MKVHCSAVCSSTSVFFAKYASLTVILKVVLEAIIGYATENSKSLSSTESFLFKSMTIIRPHRSTIYVDVVYCYRPSIAWSVGLFVCLSV